MSIEPQIHISIIVPTRNQFAMVARLVDGLSETAAQFDGDIELIIADNNSDDQALISYLDKLIKHQDSSAFAAIQVLPYPHKFNYSAINNAAVEMSRGDKLCFLNNDIEIIDANWLQALCAPLSNSGTGCVGAMLYYPDDTIQHAGVYLDAKEVAGHTLKNMTRGSTGPDNYLTQDQTVSAVTAACMLVPKSIFNEVNGFDESLAVAFNDVDLCLKIKRSGYDIVWTPKAELYHHESKSRGQSHQRSFIQKLNHKKEVFLMKRRWRNELGQ